MSLLSLLLVLVVVGLLLWVLTTFVPMPDQYRRAVIAIVIVVVVIWVLTRVTGFADVRI